MASSFDHLGARETMDLNMTPHVGGMSYPLRPSEHAPHVDASPLYKLTEPNATSDRSTNIHGLKDGADGDQIAFQKLAEWNDMV